MEASLMSPMLRPLGITFVTFLTVFQLQSCSGVGVGTTALPNDAVPNGNKLFQGTFTNQNNKVVSGIASIYLNTDSQYVVRLEGISVSPADRGLFVRANATPGGAVFKAQLRATIGSQNYIMSGVSLGSTFTTIDIYSNATTLNYGSAPMIKISQ